MLHHILGYGRVSGNIQATWPSYQPPHTTVNKEFVIVILLRAKFFDMYIFFFIPDYSLIFWEHCGLWSHSSFPTYVKQVSATNYRFLLLCVVLRGVVFVWFFILVFFVVVFGISFVWLVDLIHFGFFFPVSVSHFA